MWVDRPAYEIVRKIEVAWDTKQNEDYLPHFRKWSVDFPAATERGPRLRPQSLTNEITRIENLSYE